NGGDSQATIDGLLAGINLSGGAVELSPAAKLTLLLGAISAGQTGNAVADLFGQGTGISGVTTNNLDSVKNALVSLSTDGSGTPENMQSIVDAVTVVRSSTTGGTPPSQAELEALGITGVTPKNLAAVQAAIAATANDGSEVDTLSELQALVTPVVVSEAMASVREGAAGGTPADQVELEALGITGVTPENLAAVQAAIEATSDEGSEVDTPVELPALTDAVRAVQTGAAGGLAPTHAHLETLGITGVTPEKLAAVQAAIEATIDDGSEIDTRLELQALTDAVRAVRTGAAGGLAPTQAQMETLGINGVTPENLAAMQAAIAATDDDGSEVDTRAELQALIDAVEAVRTGAAGGTPPTEELLVTLGITGVTPE